MALFGGKTGGAGSGADSARTLRFSSGWAQLSKHLRAQESLRILDIGPTSASNINFITGLGHSIYMANLVDDAGRVEYVIPSGEGTPATYNVERFLRDNLDFSGRTFDVVTFWDTADYLPQEVLQPVIDRLYEVLEPGGQLLAFFHSKQEGEDAVFSRYHLTATDQVEIQRVGGHAIVHTYNNRQVEGLFQHYAGYKFFLAKDSLREVIVTR